MTTSTINTTSAAPTTAFAVANWFIDKSKKSRVPITHMKLQKLAYMAYGWYYAYYENPLFDDKIFAWKYGPVIANLYAMFKGCGKNIVDHYIIDGEKCSIFESDNMEESEKESRKVIEKDIEDVLNIVWRDYSQLTLGQLRNLTHRPETPWGKIVQSFNGIMKNVVIEPTDIKEYFDGLIEKYGDE
jgi:uncharacterized phage-associated protein